VLLFGENPTFHIADNDVAESPLPPDDEPPPPGGGGLVSWTTPLALLALVLFRRRRVRRADVLRQ
jgi:hypothetical protein